MKHLDQLCRGAFFLLRYRRCFAIASQTTSLQVHKTTSGCRLVLRCRFADYESTSLQDYKWLTPLASLSLRRLLVYKTTRLQVAAALGFAVAS